MLNRTTKAYFDIFATEFHPILLKLVEYKILLFYFVKVCSVFRQAIEQAIKTSSENTKHGVTISEQYRDRDEPYWFRDTLGTAAIWPWYLSFDWVSSDDFTLITCYFTPNESMVDFQDKLDNMEEVFRPFGGNSLSPAILMERQSNASDLGELGEHSHIPTVRSTALPLLTLYLQRKISTEE
ncbi:hypothetical protein J6590_072094 [Homalodisca vitripennis]|nr:hypothetical protein J6590_072094 [Homalodisca vitripennis]